MENPPASPIGSVHSLDRLEGLNAARNGGRRPGQVQGITRACRGNALGHNPANLVESPFRKLAVFYGKPAPGTAEVQPPVSRRRIAREERP